MNSCSELSWPAVAVIIVVVSAVTVVVGLCFLHYAFLKALGGKS